MSQLSSAALELPPGLPQFFFDDSLIGFQHHIARRWMPAKICPTPVLKPDKPWEGRILSFYGSVFADPEGGYRLYYTNFIPSGQWATTASPVMMARSHDGFTWHKPELGLVEYQGSKANNVVLHTHPWHFDGPGIMHEPEDKNAPWKMMPFMFDKPTPMWTDKWGLYGFTSKDGIRWTQMPKVLCKAGDRSVLMPSKVNGKYVNFTRREDMYKRHGGRVIARTESQDFVNWTDPEEVLAPDLDDEPDIEFYGMTAFARNGWYIGLLERWNSLLDVIELHLVVSRDTKKWIRTPRKPFIAATYDWNKSWSTAATTAPIIIGDQMMFYFGGRHTSHHWDAAHQYGEIGWASIAIDRFCAIEATHGGMLETVPMVWPGGELVLNADTRGDFTRHPLPLKWTGEINVELLDASGQPLAGWSGDQRGPFRGPNTHCRGVINDGGTILWPSGAKMDSLKGTAIRIRFNLKDCRLYTFEARSAK